MDEVVGGNGLKGASVVGLVDLLSIFVMERVEVGWLLTEDVFPGVGDVVEDVEWV